MTVGKTRHGSRVSLVDRVKIFVKGTLSILRAMNLRSAPCIGTKGMFFIKAGGNFVLEAQATARNYYRVRGARTASPTCSAADNDTQAHSTIQKLGRV